MIKGKIKVFNDQDKEFITCMISILHKPNKLEIKNWNLSPHLSTKIFGETTYDNSIAFFFSKIISNQQKE